METLMKLARDEGMESMTLEVRVSNEPAKALYQQLGFVSAGIRKNYYSETKEDALILWREKL
jgi:ribosomal-protein-alanine N-acetyltransferase